MHWNQAEAIALCREVERICPDYGCHVALTGGCLYKDGARKDLDLLFYRVRQVDSIDVDGLFAALAMIGIERGAGTGWVIKATWRGRASIDCFFPEVPSGNYGTAPTDDIEDDIP